jgi:nucleoside-diphosphate-sugar epimerase
MSDDRIGVLVTCCGGGIGQSIIDSLKGLKSKYRVIGSDQARYSYSVPDLDGFIELPPITHRDYVSQIIEKAISHRLNIVIPAHDFELKLFADNRDQFFEAGLQPIIPSSDFIEICRNKLECSRFFRKYTDRFVWSESCHTVRKEGVPSNVSFPLIAKPNSGSSSKEIFVLNELSDLNSVAPDHVVQSFLMPRESDPYFCELDNAIKQGRLLQVSEVSVQLLYSRESTLFGRFASVNRLKDGVPIEIVPTDLEEIWDAVDDVRKIIERFAPVGPVNLQGRITEEGLVFFEINPRFTGITGCRALFGFNEVEAVVDNFVTGEVKKLLINRGKVGVRQVACRTWPKDRFNFAKGEGGQGKNIVVLGVSSWLGRATVRSLLSEGHVVIGIVRQKSLAETRRAYQDVRNLTIICDDDDAVASSFGWADIVLNFISGRPPEGSKAIMDASNRQLVLLNRAAFQGVSRIINISTKSIYGSQDHPCGENTLPEPIGTYGLCKLFVEQSLQYLQEGIPSLRTISIRLGRLYGPEAGLRVTEFPHKMVIQGLRGETLEVDGNPELFDLIDIRDAVSGILFTINECLDSDYDCINLSGASPVSVSTYAKLCKSALEEIYNTSIDIHKKEQTRGNFGNVVDITRIRNCGWSPKYDVTQTIRDLALYLDKNENP